MVSGKRSENPTWRRHFTRIFFRRLSVGLSVLRVPEVKWRLTVSFPSRFVREAVRRFPTPHFVILSPSGEDE